jgi:4-diphosphocytidyl-2-C-methyl-D-erythritol kinase
MRIFSPAKVNLHLEILGKRTDGYHDIQTLMQRIDLCDEMEMNLGGEGIRLTTEGEEVSQGMENLVAQAAQSFFREARIPGKGVTIHLKKKIPVAAGLGGGSSNAAAVLMGLNVMLSAGRDEQFLMTLGAKIGADVPFFLFQKSALARGIGEKLTAVALPSPLWFLVVIPPFRISTAWAYAVFDQISSPKRERTPLKGSYPLLEDLLPVLQNDLEITTFTRHPEIADLKKSLLAMGAKGTLMSGSGPATFALFTTRQETERTAENLNLPPGWRRMIARGI